MSDTLPSRHKIRNSNHVDLRPSTLPLGHGLLRWTNIDPSLVQRLACVGLSVSEGKMSGQIWISFGELIITKQCSKLNSERWKCRCEIMSNDAVPKREVFSTATAVANNIALLDMKGCICHKGAIDILHLTRAITDLPVCLYIFV